MAVLRRRVEGAGASERAQQPHRLQGEDGAGPIGQARVVDEGDGVADRRESSQWSDHAFTRGRVAGMTDHCHDHRLGQALDRDLDGELVRRVREQIAIDPENVVQPSDRIGEESTENLRKGMEAVLEARHDPEISAHRPAGPRTGPGSRRGWRGGSGRPPRRSLRAIRLSHVAPCFPANQPMPPPSVKPEIPTTGLQPSAAARPKGCVTASTSPARSPGSQRRMRAPGSTSAAFIGERSIIRPPSQTEAPRISCPPLRTAISRPRSLAKTTQRATSLSLAQRAIAAGCLSVIGLKLATRRSSS